MPSTIAPRERLSLSKHSTLGHDLCAALKASPPQPIDARTKAIKEECQAPPPSPVDFGFAAINRPENREIEEWLDPLTYHATAASQH
ncbi:uncharacterized protein K452DRAFT_293890 [Aplosporella prunicola CBS 121167]|uniref:Uncharacterized protein n=1 Tax=Aplosporella prunicola CBS 121167 TaxID=1176127 RepID=A0A6A6BVV0_9PEZI|nr:uncharacterized protein K452DRAFT_293890 [Aplosporella prunicola CBS 121167]KAF2147483.1 hypothetical protein K452DRAFT_293890 [Aplosporella prunicola CBS 121167]